MNAQKTTFIICIMYGQNSEYWCGLHNAKNDNTSKLIENALHYETEADAVAELENVVKPFGEAENWDVTYSIDEQESYTEDEN